MAADVESGVERTCEREVAFSIMRSAAAALLCLLSSAEPKVAAAEPKVEGDFYAVTPRHFNIMRR